MLTAIFCACVRLCRFPVADVLWTLVMAVDVYLIVFHCYDTRGLRKLEWKYMVGITVFTFVPAFVMLFIDTEERGPMYGGVTVGTWVAAFISQSPIHKELIRQVLTSRNMSGQLWCAIAPNWVLFRIVIYYVPIWTSILITIFLYILVGIEIIRRRMALQSLTHDSIVPLDDAVMPTGAVAMSDLNDLNHDDDDMPILVHEAKSLNIFPPSSPGGPIPSPPQPVSTFHSAGTGSDSLVPVTHSTSIPHVHSSTKTKSGSKSSSRFLFRQYILMPLFFFLALLSVWVAPSTNRVAAFLDPTFGSYPLLLAVGISGSLRGFWNGLIFVTVGMKSRRRRKKEEEKEEDKRGIVGNMTVAP